MDGLLKKLGLMVKVVDPVEAIKMAFRRRGVAKRPSRAYPHSSERQRARYAKQRLYMAPGLAGVEIIQRAGEITPQPRVRRTHNG